MVLVSVRLRWWNILMLPLLKVEDGIMKVIDTEGDNYLGGKNLDYAIVDQLIIPHIQERFSIDDLLSDDIKRKKNIEVV